MQSFSSHRSRKNTIPTTAVDQRYSRPDDPNMAWAGVSLCLLVVWCLVRLNSAQCDVFPDRDRESMESCNLLYNLFEEALLKDKDNLDILRKAFLSNFHCQPVALTFNCTVWVDEEIQGSFLLDWTNQNADATICDQMELSFNTPFVFVFYIIRNTPLLQASPVQLALRLSSETNFTGADMEAPAVQNTLNTLITNLQANVTTDGRPDSLGDDDVTHWNVILEFFFSTGLALFVNIIATGLALFVALGYRHMLRKKVQESSKAFGLYKGFSLAAKFLAPYHALNIFILFLTPKYGLRFKLRLAELGIAIICSLIWMVMGYHSPPQYHWQRRTPTLAQKLESGWCFFHASFLLLMVTVNAIPLSLWAIGHPLEMLAVTLLLMLPVTILGSVAYAVTVCLCITHPPAPATLGPKDKERDIEKGSTLELAKDALKEKKTSQEYFV